MGLLGRQHALLALGWIAVIYDDSTIMGFDCRNRAQIVAYAPVGNGCSGIRELEWSDVLDTERQRGARRILIQIRCNTQVMRGICHIFHADRRYEANEAGVG